MGGSSGVTLGGAWWFGGSRRQEGAGDPILRGEGPNPSFEGNAPPAAFSAVWVIESLPRTGDGIPSGGQRAEGRRQARGRCAAGGLRAALSVAGRASVPNP